MQLLLTHLPTLLLLQFLLLLILQYLLLILPPAPHFDFAPTPGSPFPVTRAAAAAAAVATVRVLAPTSALPSAAAAPANLFYCG